MTSRHACSESIASAVCCCRVSAQLIQSQWKRCGNGLQQPISGNIRAIYHRSIHSVAQKKHHRSSVQRIALCERYNCTFL